MSREVSVDVGRRELSLPVNKLGDAEKARFIATYPGDGVRDSSAVDKKHVDWFVEVTERATALSEQEIWSLKMEDMLTLCSAVAKEALDLEEPEIEVPSDEWMVIQ